MVEIDRNFLDSDHIKEGFCALGSGDIFPYFALVGLKHFDVPNRSLLEAKLIAYRVIQDAIAVAAFGLGEPISMVEIRAGAEGQPGKAKALTQEELRILKDKVDEWRGVEGEALTEYVLGPPAPALADADAGEVAGGVSGFDQPGAPASDET